MAVRASTVIKAKKVQALKQQLSEYNTVAIASLEKVRASQLQRLRKKLQENANMLVVKNSIISRAVSEITDKAGIEKLAEHLTGPNLYLFTNLNPFKLVMLLEKSRVKAAARAGDLAAFDVTVPAGNTGLPPGPIISQFTAVGLRTRIESGSVFVSKDTMVVKKGEPISAQLASLLAKLGIKPVEVGLSLKLVFDDGVILFADDLSIDIDEFRQSIEQAHQFAFNLSMEAAYPTAENTSMLVKVAHQKAFSLAMSAGIINSDTIEELIRKANMQMQSLSEKLDEAEKKGASSS
ncbi:MAG: 50S ribosomal protein L10 [Candidatus Bathyarchaeota archaeon]|nr:50S ribosomal protein L10 [Candidatus Bathyarchaeum tardum]WGM89291.1 MAG: 50S ribosomal protein L10 [Candidatus Bathyarchaeum tardum]WNZ28426.1 MAG: 50S ribosomal protein L10 [Candidatus Bathyarchaeota archaeon]